MSLSALHDLRARAVDREIECVVVTPLCTLSARSTSAPPGPAALQRTALDLRLKTADGSFKYFQCTARWVPEKEEVYGTLRDAEERIEHEIQLKLLKAINDHLPVCLWAIDQRGVFVLHDGKGLESAGLKPAQFLGLNLFEIYPEEGTAVLRKALEGTKAPRRRGDHHVRLRRQSTNVERVTSNRGARVTSIRGEPCLARFVKIFIYYL